jgi:hypothetical protein
MGTNVHPPAAPLLPIFTTGISCQFMKNSWQCCWFLVCHDDTWMWRPNNGTPSLIAYHPSVLVHCSLWPSFTPIHTNVMLKQTSRRYPIHTVARVVDWVTLSNDMYSTMLSSLIPNADPLWRLQTQESSLITNSYCSFVLLKHLITTSVHSRLELPS